MLNTQEIKELFEIFSSLNPHPTIELDYEDAYTLLIAVVLSAQTTDVRVNHVTKTLFQKANTPQKMLDLGLENIKEIIKSLGFYNTKAANVYTLSKKLIEDYQGNVTSNREDLESLPGVGRKSANVFLNTIYDQPLIGVDTHVFRVSNRIGLCKAKTPLETEEALLKCVPQEYLKHAHHWLVLHGRYVCKAKKPGCVTCPIKHLCEFVTLL